MLGGLLGDFVRGGRALRSFPKGVREGIRLHRRIDKFTDHAEEVVSLRRTFPPAFRRWAGIVIDLAFDHELARRWDELGQGSLPGFDIEIRRLLQKHSPNIPGDLQKFMEYADRRGLFTAYRYEQEMLLSLKGIGGRMRRSNPLHEVWLVWPELREPCRRSFARFFPRLQGEVADWLNLRSTSTGS